MAERLPPIFVTAYLRRRDHEQPSLDRPRAKKDVPMSLAGRDGESGWDRD